MTGATGAIGSAVCDALLARGDEVVGSQPRPGEGAADEPDGHLARVGSRRTSARRPLRSTAWTPWSTSSARRSTSAGTTRSRSGSARAASARPRTWSTACSPPTRARRRSSPGPPSGSTALENGDRILDEDSAAGSDFLAQVVVDWEAAATEAAKGGRARRHDPHRPHPRARVRPPEAAPSDLQAGRRRPARRRRSVHAVDPHRRRGRADPLGARHRGDLGPDQLVGAEPGDEQDLFEDARQGAEAPCGLPRARSSPSRRFAAARWPTSSPRACASSPAGRSTRASPSATPSSSRRSGTCSDR